MADITVATQLANMQIPESWANYVVQRAVEKDQFFTSGVIRPVPDLAQKLMANGGYVVNMPMFKALADVDPQIPDDTKDISLNAIQTDKAQARLFGYNQAWSATDLAAELIKTDPLEAIAESIGDYWRHINQKTLLTTLDGVFASESMKGINQFDATDGRTSKDATFSLKNFNRARFLLGDRYQDLAIVVVHSDILRQLQDANVVDKDTNKIIINSGNPVPTAISAPNPGDSIKGVKVIADDSLPVSGGKYTSYLFATGAYGWSEKPPAHAVETGRDPLRFNGVDYLINRRRFVLAPQGMSWDESAFQQAHPHQYFPSMTDMADGKNWVRKYDPKTIPMIKFTTSNDPITPVSDGGH